MSKKKILPLLTLLSVGLIATSCGGDNGVPPQDRTFKVAPTSVTTTAPGVKIYLGQTYQIESIIYPAVAHDAKLAYKSLDESVAVVNSNGLITAVGTGSTFILIGSIDDSEVVFDKVAVTVTQYLGNSVLVDDAIAQMQAYQALMYGSGLDKVRAYEFRSEQTIVDGKVLNSSLQDSVITASKSDAFIDIQEIDRDTRTVDGGTFITPYRWTFFTNTSYNTILYHIGSSNSKTKLIVDSKTYLGKPRLDALMHILNTVFTNGRTLMTNTFDNALNSRVLNQFDIIKGQDDITYLGGSVNDDAVSFAYTYSQNRVSGIDEERYNSIPYGIDITESYTQDILWVKGISRILDLTLRYDYTYEGHTYAKIITMKYAMEVENEVTFDYPIDSEYRAVKDISEL